MCFLGGSGTFLGVLATIVILFVISDRSNLIRAILGEVKEKIARSVESLQVNTDLSSVFNSDAYKAIIWFQKAGEGEESLLSEASKQIALVNTRRLELQSKYVDVEIKDPEVLEKIEKSKEKSLAPLFSFVFCFVLFVLDELLKANCVGQKDFLLTFLLFFIIVSYEFWLIVWANFIIRMRHDICKRRMPKNPTLKDKIINKCRKILAFLHLKRYFCDQLGNPRKILLMIFRMIIVVFFVCAMMLLYKYVKPINKMWILSIGIILPIFIIGAMRLSAYECENKFTFVFLCGHVLTLILTSLLLAIVYLFFSSFLGIYSEIGFSYPVGLLKFFSFLFVGLNGIVLPFLLPYYCYDQYYCMAEKKVRDSKKEADVVVEKIMQEIKDFSSRLPSK